MKFQLIAAFLLGMLLSTAATAQPTPELPPLANATPYFPNSLVSAPVPQPLTLPTQSTLSSGYGSALGPNAPGH